MSKAKRQTKPNPTTIRLRPEHEVLLLEIAKAHHCYNRQGQPSWRDLIDRLRMGAGNTIYVSTAGELLVEKTVEVDEYWEIDKKKDNPKQKYKS